MTKIVRFEDLDAWKRARKLTREIYRISGNRTFRKDHGLRDQARNAAVSTMANIAEGFDSGFGREFSRFLGYSLRSASEVQCHLYVALDQEYIETETFNSVFGETVGTKSCVIGLIRYLRSRQSCQSTSNVERQTSDLMLEPV